MFGFYIAFILHMKHMKRMQAYLAVCSTFQNLLVIFYRLKFLTYSLSPHSLVHLRREFVYDPLYYQ